MKKKLTILAFGLLLAVGWTNVASAQKAVSVPANQVTDISKLKVQLAHQQMNTSTAEEDAVIASGEYQRGGALYAPQRAANNYTTPVVKTRSFYEGFNYTWMDGTTQKTANLTDVVTNPDQMWYMLKYIYNTAAIPGPWYNKAYETTQTYPGFAYGWEDRGTPTMPTNIVINLSGSYSSIFYIDFYDSTNTDSLYTLTATDLYNNYGCSRTTYSYNGSNYYIAYISGGGNITIPLSVLPAQAQNGVVLHIAAVRDGGSSAATISVNGGTAQTLTYNSPQEYYFTVSPTASTGTVTDAPFPTENGHTVCLVKVKSNSETAPTETSTYSDLTTIFNDYVESIEVLTDGLRVGEDGDRQAGTVFTYSGLLSKFFFIGKGKLAKFGYQAPFYGMFEEYSPTTTATGDEITDFYSKMLLGDSYGIVHDCSSVIYRKHQFSMSGNASDEEKSLTNLILYLPDERGRSPYDSIGSTYHSRNYQLQPQVGLYTITLTAEAQPAANYSETNRMYQVTCNWVSSLNTIVDMEVPQTYELWIFVYDEQGNPVPVPQSEGGLLYKGPNTTYTYQVPQYPDSYTIIYRVKGWPTEATNNPDNGGDFYAWSNLDDVLIPGYNDFLTLHLDHYESDFVIDEEHNYYRNFFTVDNQNPENVLTAQRVIDGENLFKLYRYDVADENNKVKAAELKFYQSGNDIRYKVDYFDQSILPGYELPMTTPVVIDTAGVVATLGSDKYVKVTSADDLTSGQYLIVYETDQVAFNGGLTTLDAGNNVISVTISNNTIPSNATTDAASFTLDINNGSGTVKSASGYYIGRDASSNGMNASTTTQYSNTFSMNGTNAVITGTGGYQLRFNSSSGDNNYRFRYYGPTSQKAIQLYKKTSGGGGTTPTVNPVGDVQITFASGNADFRSITVAGNNATTSWSFAQNGTSLPTGWSTTKAFSEEDDNSNSCFMSQGGTITVPASLLNGSTTVTVTINAKTYNSQYSSCAVTVAGAETETITITDYTNWTNYTWTVNGTTNGAKAMAPKKAEPTRAFTLLDNQIDNTNYTGQNEQTITLNAPWQATSVYYQTNGYFYIINGGNLKFTVPAGYNGASLKFVVHNSNNTYYNGTFVFNSSAGTSQTITCNTADQDYETTFTNVRPGDVITITGTHGSNGYSPDFSRMYVYVEGGSSEYDLNDPLYLAGIKIVDQFKAETKNDTHPYRYGYYLQYDPETGDPKTSSVQEVPVQHTGSNPHGYYTTDEIQGDTKRTLTMNVMNAEMEMGLADNPAIYYYTLDRKPSTTPNDPYEELSKIQIRPNGTYQETYTKLTQYNEQEYSAPCVVPRYDTYNVQTGNYNAYMNYVPIVWTHGEQPSNRRIKWETEQKHNSYGAPIWKTGVGQVTLYPSGLKVERQLGKNGSTNWKDENNDSCSVYMIKNLHALGELPTNNTVGNQNGYVPYVPYWFNVYAYSPSGQLRGYSWVGEPGVDPDNTGSPGSGVVNNIETDRYLWHIYGGRTNSGDLQWTKSNTWADNMIFGALDDITDLQIIVRFYYVVDGMAGMRAGGPAGYGAESPGVGPEIETGIIENWANRNIVSTIYVNPQGMQSTVPFDGVNIVINRYDDGTTSTSKVIK